MTTPKLDREPYEISVRVYLALWAKVLSLEADAQTDELFAASLEDPGHRRRQNLLAQVQRDDAGRFRNFLADARIRVR